MKFVRRIRAAFRTNDTQVGAVVLFSMLNLLAAFKRPEFPPIGLLVFCVMLWPTVAFVGNLISPIPERTKIDG